MCLQRYPTGKLLQQCRHAGARLARTPADPQRDIAIENITEQAPGARPIQGRPFRASFVVGGLLSAALA